MRHRARRDPLEVRRPGHSFGKTVLGAIFATLLIPVAVMAVAYPAVAVGAAALGLAARPLVRSVRRLRRARLRTGRTRRICVAKLGVCVEV